uniref:Uncharacterized protein n=1 Tax=Chromera velia CCMP2878 TaxID=1169474 RepID=A0A0G4F245_9ALVE|eukprot:Cvel_14735.t1-p1 / transcript=Cvel_14735.t1 / gene=Cvel_14735 / organism=Chromera_velia_CCMP2878 / gene_product=hypothetical protein / transcript_product=hypothetical protein / location=Cvel_scaffold1060:19420-24232(-) / protein_length=1115 / sequence_SO=supercontig / SO=protein_coding / is_pseudo=false
MEECQVVRKIFPESADRKLHLAGSQGGGQLYRAEGGSLSVFFQSGSEDYVQDAVKESARSGNLDYLRVVEEVEGLHGVWVFADGAGNPLGFHYSLHMIESIVLPDRMEVDLGCDQPLQVSTKCSIAQFESHLESGWIGSPCTYTGECDEDAACVEVHPYLKQCIEKEKVTDEMKASSGPHPVWPWDNCFYSRTCTVEGYQCFANSRFPGYARCLLEGSCPTPRGSELLENTERWGVRRLSEVSPQVFQRRVLEAPHKIGWDAHEPWEVGRKDKRRNLADCLHLQAGRERTRRRRLRRLKEKGDAAGFLKEDDHHDAPILEPLGTSASAVMGFSTAEHVNVVKSLMEGPCKEAAMDFRPVYSDSASSGSSSSSTVPIFDGLSSSSSASSRVEDDEEQIAESAEAFLDLFDDAWASEELRRENGGPEGWDCDHPLGPVAKVEDGAVGRMEARMQADREGWLVWKAVPETEQERMRRRLRIRHRRLHASIRRLQERRGEGEVEDLIYLHELNLNVTHAENQLSSHGSDFSSLTGVQFGSAEDLFEERMYGSLPAPPDRYGERGTQAEWPDFADPCKDVPSNSWGPEKTVSWGMNCGPQYTFAPIFDCGISLNFGFQAAWAPMTTLNLNMVTGNEVHFAPDLTVGPVMNFGIEYDFAPTGNSGVSLLFTTSFTFIPSWTASIRTTITPLTFLPDVFEDWVLRRPEEKLRKKGKLPKEKKEEEDKKEPKKEDNKPQWEAKSHPDVHSPADLFRTLNSFSGLDTLENPVSRNARPDNGKEDGKDEETEKKEERDEKKADRKEKESMRLADIPVVSLPEESSTKKLLDRIGIRRSLNLDAFFVVEPPGFVVHCPREYLDERRNPTGRIYVFSTLPQDRRLEEEGKLFLSETCTTPLPSDILKDFPYLPPHAVHAIKLMEKGEALLPPPLRIAANQFMSLLGVVASGEYPDAQKWLEGFYKETGQEGDKEKEKDLEGAETKSPLPLSWARATKLALASTPLSKIAELPSFFPKDAKFRQAPIFQPVPTELNVKFPSNLPTNTESTWGESGGGLKNLNKVGLLWEEGSSVSPSSKNVFSELDLPLSGFLQDPLFRLPKINAADSAEEGAEGSKYKTPFPSLRAL